MSEDAHAGGGGVGLGCRGLFGRDAVTVMKTGDLAEPRHDVDSSVFPPGNNMETERVITDEEVMEQAHLGEPCVPYRVALDLEGITRVPVGGELRGRSGAVTWHVYACSSEVQTLSRAPK